MFRFERVRSPFNLSNEVSIDQSFVTQKSHTCPILGEILAAEQTIVSIERSDSQVWALLALGETLLNAQQLERAKVVWAKVRELIDATEVSEVRPGALSTLGQALAKAKLWEQAETVINILEKIPPRAQALYVLGIALAKEQRWEQAEAVWRSADRIISAMEESEERAEELHFVGVVLEGETQQ